VVGALVAQAASNTAKGATANNFFIISLNVYQNWCEFYLLR